MLGVPNNDRVARRRDATRREILQAAWDVVGEAGWSGLTQRAVATRVGMRAPSLYSHFESKAAMVDAMFGQAWEEYDAAVAGIEEDPDGEPRALLQDVARQVFDAFVVDHDRWSLMTQRPVPGFTPSSESYAPAVRALGRLHVFFDRIGLDDPDASDLWTALISGLVSQQIANDPDGDRWRRLLPRTIDMFADAVGIDERTTR